MNNDDITKSLVTGLWTYDTRAGDLLKAKFDKKRLLDALSKIPGDTVELTIWPNRNPKDDRASSHFLFLAKPFEKRRFNDSPLTPSNEPQSPLLAPMTEDSIPF